jgi:small subunit ribosomal protein S11
MHALDVNFEEFNLLKMYNKYLIKSFSSGRIDNRMNNQDGNIHIKCSFNNTYICLTDKQGNVKTWASGGSSGFKGSRRSTTFAAQIAAEKIGLRAKELGFSNIDIYIKGVGSGRRSVPKGLTKVGLNVLSINDVTP